MSNQGTDAPVGVNPETWQAFVEHETGTARFAEQIATSVEDFLSGLRAIAADATPGQAVSLLLLEISQVLLAGARLGAQQDVAPRAEFQPDVGPEPDVDTLRLRLAELLEPVDDHRYVFDPYDGEVVTSLLSDDLTAIAADLENGLRHFRSGNVDEALWWWQFSYVSSWGALAGAVLKALLSVVAHDRLDIDRPEEAEQIEAAEAVLDADGSPA